MYIHCILQYKMEVVKFSEVFVQLFLKKVAEGTNKIEMLIMFVGKMTHLPIVYDGNLNFLFGFFLQ